MRETLTQHTDADLKALITDAQQILEARDKQRKEEAMQRIRAMAAEVGLSVELKGPRKKRGRPRKTDNGGTAHGKKQP